MQLESYSIKAYHTIFNITLPETPSLQLPFRKIAIVSLTAKLDRAQKVINNYTAIAESVVF